MSKILMFKTKAPKSVQMTIHSGCSFAVSFLGYNWRERSMSMFDDDGASYVSLLIRVLMSLEEKAAALSLKAELLAGVHREIWMRVTIITSEEYIYWSNIEIYSSFNLFERERS